MKLLFVCSGNTCRSPMAAAVANASALYITGGAFYATSKTSTDMPITGSNLNVVSDTHFALSGKSLGFTGSNTATIKNFKM